MKRIILNKDLKGVNDKPCEYLEEQHLDLQEHMEHDTDFVFILNIIV